MGDILQPPVTVSVITYNSSKTVIETLDSIYQQTYPNLELVISDDCSTDDTVRVCRNWIDAHQGRFLRAEVLESERNTGTSANLNRAWDACRTRWDKDIAGDDILFPNCIEDNIAFVTEHPEAVVVFSKTLIFETHGNKRVWLDYTWHDDGFFKLSMAEQYSYLLNKGNRLPAAPCFYDLEKLRELGIRHDERIPLLEDYPKWVNLLRKGIELSYFDKPTVGYRHDSQSLSAGLFSPVFFKSNILFYLYYYLDEIDSEEKRDSVYQLIASQLLPFYAKTYDEVTRTRQSWDFRIGHLVLAPFRYLKQLLSRLSKFLTRK